MKFVFFLFLFCAMQVFGADDDDVRNLLNEANKALESPVQKPAEGGETRHRKNKRKPASENSGNSDEGEESSSSTEPKNSAPLALPPARLVPLNSPDLNQILAVDLSEKKRELTDTYPRSVVRLTAGLDWLGDGYGLIQDDDTFTHIGGGALTGLLLQYNPAWLLPFLLSENTSLSLSLNFSAGYFWGQGLMRRTGVQTGDQNYPISAFPASVEIGPVFSLWRKVGIQVAYGVGAEFIHQSGQSNWDTVTNMFWGDTASVGLRGYLSDAIEIYASWQFRGLLMGSSPRVTGSTLVAGVGFEFAN